MIERRHLDHDGIRFAYADRGAGPAMVLQHGLGGDARSREAVRRPRAPARPRVPGPRRDTAARAGSGAVTSGRSPPTSRRCSTRLGIGDVILGGISMGAGVALRFALEEPGLRALVLVRPAWWTGPTRPTSRCSRLSLSCLPDEGRARSTRRGPRAPGPDLAARYRPWPRSPCRPWSSAPSRTRHPFRRSDKAWCGLPARRDAPQGHSQDGRRGPPRRGRHRRDRRVSCLMRGRSGPCDAPSARLTPGRRSHRVRCSPRA